MNTRKITITKNGEATTTVTNSELETSILAHTVALSLEGGDTLALSGELGAGKTAFVKGLAEALEVTHTITSPTFVVMKVYNIPDAKNDITTLCHVDAYRLSSGQDLEDIGIRDYMSAPHVITVIEWADRVKDIIPEDAIWMRFEHLGE